MGIMLSSFVKNWKYWPQFVFLNTNLLNVLRWCYLFKTKGFKERFSTDWNWFSGRCFYWINSSVFPIFLWTTMYCCSFSTLLKKYSFYESLSSFQHCEWILLHCCLYIYSIHCFLQQQSSKMGCLIFLLLNSFFSLSFFVMQFLFSGLSWLQFTWFFSSSVV